MLRESASASADPTRHLDPSVRLTQITHHDLDGYGASTVVGQFAEVARIVHVPGYLIAVYAEAPTGTPDFDAAAAVPTGGLRIGLP